MTETMNWIVGLHIVNFSEAAVAVTILLTILYLIVALREWMKS